MSGAFGTCPFCIGGTTSKGRACKTCKGTGNTLMVEPPATTGPKKSQATLEFERQCLIHEIEEREKFEKYIRMRP